MKLSATQINGLRLAAEVPSCLSSESYGRATIRSLLKQGLIESYGCMAIGDGYVKENFGITDAGRSQLKEDQETK